MSQTQPAQPKKITKAQAIAALKKDFLCYDFVKDGKFCVIFTIGVGPLKGKRVNGDPRDLLAEMEAQSASLTTDNILDMWKQL